MTEQERLGISDETMESIRQFFLEHSVPKMIEEKRRKEKDNEQLHQE